MNPSFTPAERTSPSIHVRRRRIFFRSVVVLTCLLLILSVTGFFYARHWVRHAITDSLPQIDGTVTIPGLSAPVTVKRDIHGVPHIRAASLDDLVLAQGYVTAQDRLWQMDALRRHASGELAEILGASMVPHDRAQRILQLRAAADRAVATLPPNQLHILQMYADGVNASIQTQLPHLPLEFRLLRYQPSPWTPRDSLLIGLVMFQDLTNTFPEQLNREALSTRLPENLLADLYPVVTWRDHPPAQPAVDLTVPQTDIPDIPLDESQTRLEQPKIPGSTHPVASSLHGFTPSTNTVTTADLIAVRQIFAPVLSCPTCRAGSNDWVVSGAHTATGKPLLSNDMHLNHNVPGIWYEADIEFPTPTGDLHVAGVSLPGVPFIIVGHNDHVAWGFTNLGAQVQDVYVEHIRGVGPTTEYEAADGSWRPVLHQQETVHVKSGRDVIIDVQATQHGSTATPIISPIFPSESRALALHWAIYDPANITPSFLPINSAADGAALVSAFSTFGGPAQNLVYADDQGHIGYHSVGRIPVRGSFATPSPLSAIPTDALDTTQDWVGYIPYDQLPQSADPANGFLATANNRITTDAYPFPIALDWSAPYRNERIWKLLADRALATHDHLTSADMLAIQTDVYSEVDHVLAQRLAYAIDHATRHDLNHDKRLHQAADLLRNWNGKVDADAPAPAIVDATRNALWSLLINSQAEKKTSAQPNSNPGAPNTGSAAHAPDLSLLYTWGNKAYAEEWLVMHTPSRWLSARYSNWDDLLAASVSLGLKEAHSPYDLNKWHYGVFRPIEIEHPIYSKSRLLQQLIGRASGIGIQPQSGDDTTIKQVGRTFGPSERFTANLADLDQSTLNIVLGESANPASPWFMDQWPAWYRGTTFQFPYTPAAVEAATAHTLVLTPR